MSESGYIGDVYVQCCLYDGIFSLNWSAEVPIRFLSIFLLLSCFTLCFLRKLFQARNTFNVITQLVISLYGVFTELKCPCARRRWQSFQRRMCLLFRFSGTCMYMWANFWSENLSLYEILYKSLTADNIFSSDISNRRVMEGSTFVLLLFLAFVKNMFVFISVRPLTEFSCI